jgi:Flp pilus assembly protein TadD
MISFEEIPFFGNTVQETYMKSLSLVSAAVLLVFFTVCPGSSGVLGKQKDGERAQAFLQQAETAWSKNNFEDAARAYRQALKIKPDLDQAHYGLGLALARLERYQDAVSSFREATHYRPSWAKAHKDLGVTYLKLKRWPEAEKAFKSSLQHQPQDAEAYYDLGVAQGKQGKHKEAREAFEKALGLKPDYVQALDNLGMANIKLNRWAEAKSSFEKAIGLKANDPEAHLGLLACYIQQGDSQGAARTYKTLATLDKSLTKKADELLGR